MTGLLVDPIRAAELARSFASSPSWDLTSRQLCDLEMLMNGGFSPLPGFMCRMDYESCIENMRLADGTLWPVPVLLDVSESLARKLAHDSTLVLRDPEGVTLAMLHVRDVWQPDRDREARAVYGTTSLKHPGVRRIMEDADRWVVGGPVEGIRLPDHYDFATLRHTPAEIRREIARNNWQTVIGFPTRRLIHRAEYELTRRIAERVGGGLLLHPIVETSRPTDIDNYMRMRCYQAVLHRYPEPRPMLSILPLAARTAGPREVLWKAIIEKNHGCTHLFVRDDDTPRGVDGECHDDTVETKDLLTRHATEIGIVVHTTRRMAYVTERDTFVAVDEVPAGVKTQTLSDDELLTCLADGGDIPDWFTFPEIAEELRNRHPSRHRAGFTVFFTGLSGSGKSTIANMVRVRLLERGGRHVSFLDGDLIRKHLSSELGFSREHRNINIRRIGFVASEITKNGGIAICAPIAPYDAIRREVRCGIEAVGGFVLVFVDTPIEVCEQRDRKGLYAKARAGLIPEFTGVSDPYEPPQDAEIVVRTNQASAEEGANQVVEYLLRNGYLEPPVAKGVPAGLGDANRPKESRPGSRER